MSISVRHRAKTKRYRLDRELVATAKYLTTSEIGLRTVTPPTWNGETIPVTLTNLRKGQEYAALMKAWGIPLRFDDLEALVHLSRGGWGVFTLPPMIDVYAWISRAVKHPEAVQGLDLLARVAIHSQLTLSEAAPLIVDMARLDQLATTHPSARANHWLSIAIHIVNAWQARADVTGAVGDGLGDVPLLAERLAELRDMCAQWQVAQLELDLERRRNMLRAKGITS